MSYKEELKNLIISLTPEELEIAIKIFQEHSLKMQEGQQSHSPTDQK